MTVDPEDGLSDAARELVRRRVEDDTRAAREEADAARAQAVEWGHAYERAEARVRELLEQQAIDRRRAEESLRAAEGRAEVAEIVTRTRADVYDEMLDEARKEAEDYPRLKRAWDRVYQLHVGRHRCADDQGRRRWFGPGARCATVVALEQP